MFRIADWSFTWNVLFRGSDVTPLGGDLLQQQGDFIGCNWPSKCSLLWKEDSQLQACSEHGPLIEMYVTITATLLRRGK